MSSVATATASRTISLWRDIVLPREHGSWSLAFEPVVLGLLVAPSPAGACLGVAVAGGFFARRPLRMLWRETDPHRRVAAGQAFALCGSVAAVGVSGAIAAAGFAWLAWLTPALVAGLVFLGFDLRLAGRDEAAEVAGSAAFAWLPAVFVILGGGSPAAAVALAALMLGRSVPAVLAVRAALRGAKTGEWRVRTAVIAACVALSAAFSLAYRGLAPWSAVALLAAFAVGTAGLLVTPRPVVRARTLGMAEGIAGLVFVLLVAVTWPL
jgi:hypothetical protein